jgi:hypothetical protein
LQKFSKIFDNFCHWSVVEVANDFDFDVVNCVQGETREIATIVDFAALCPSVLTTPLKAVKCAN